MRRFESRVQEMKYKALKSVAMEAYNDTLLPNLNKISKGIISGDVPTMRCCVYKEREIFDERIKLAMGGNRSDKNIIEVITMACDECPGGYEVTNACRGCLAHQCESACRQNAIFYDHNHVACIDKSKCVNCGACAKACPYNAIINRKRPCESSCLVKAINVGNNSACQINLENCIQCGNCTTMCPFGAIVDKSFILNTIDILRKSDNNTRYKTYAVIAPSIASQFKPATVNQIVTGLKELGFADVYEAAVGADMVADSEARELAEKGFLLSSCCPAFVAFVKHQFPQFAENISHNLSPMATIAKFLKERDETCKIVFIGPCTAKKEEIRRPDVHKYVDNVITFTELEALLDCQSIVLGVLPETTINDGSYYGRVFGRSKGLTEAVTQALKENSIEGFEFKPCVCNGIEECRLALLKKAKGMADFNFIEGMACTNGCVGGAGCLTHNTLVNGNEVTKHAKSSPLSIHDAINNIK